MVRLGSWHWLLPRIRSNGILDAPLRLLYRHVHTGRGLPLSQYLRPIRPSLAAPGPHWLLLLLLLTVALTGFHLGHFHSGVLANVYQPQMPLRVGLAIAGSAAVLAVEEHGQDHSDSAVYYSGSSRTLSFDVCGGFAQQRMALLSGIILALELNRTMILPQVMLDDTPPVNSSIAPVAVAFGEMFNVDHFVEHMLLLGVSVVVDPPRSTETFLLRLGQPYDHIKALAVTHASRQHLRVDCPALKVPADLMVKHEQLVFAAMDALQPSIRLLDIIHMVEGHLQGLSDTNAYNILHLRTEDDWVAFCAHWERPTAGGIMHDNCMNNTATVGDQLRLHRVDRQVPLMLSARASHADYLLQQAVRNLETHDYKVVLRDEVLGHSLKLPALAREEVALVDYYLALSCQQFVGNSVSVSSALLLMERWHTGRFATYYNGGNIPLEAFMPLYQMPWVFTYNDWSAGTEYDYMVKAAVTSGIEVARMKPYCMYSGSTSAEMYQWFVSKGVTIIQHEPAWRDVLIKEGARNMQQNLVHSHLYKTGGTLVGTFQRIDIPILRQFDQYNYVLFTDCDVYFRQQMKLVDWGTPLPTAVGMGYEGQDVFPYNAGIMLLNMPYMRKTNKKFLNWIISQKNGLYYPGYGPLDQGAFNQFYEEEIRGKPISKNFNAMMFHQFRPEARIVHMNGPKPNHYLQWLTSGTCAFHNMCEMGINNGACKYAMEYTQFAPNWDVATTLRKLCGNMQAGIWHAG